MSRIYTVFMLLLGVVSFAHAQSAQDPIYVTGYLKDAETREPVPFATVVLPSAGVGTSCDADGKFRIQVFPSDSLVFMCTGYKTSYYKVPADKDHSFTVFIAINMSTNMLGAVEVFPYGTEQEFKEAFLALETEDEKTKILEEKLKNRTLASMGDQMGNDGGLNYRQSMQDYSDRVHNKTFAPTLSFLNPFAWIEFIKSIQKEQKKK